VKTAPSNRGGCVGEKSGKADLSDTAAHRSSQPISDLLDDARRRIEDDAFLAEWLLDLQARIRRRQLIFEACDVYIDFDDLLSELEHFKLCKRYLRGEVVP
jgi:hypothetical protein